jgi:hypothetical protein
MIALILIQNITSYIKYYNIRFLVLRLGTVTFDGLDNINLKFKISLHILDIKKLFKE